MAIARSLARRPTHSYRRSREVCSRCVRWSHRSSPRGIYLTLRTLLHTCTQPPTSSNRQGGPSPWTSSLGAHAVIHMQQLAMMAAETRAPPLVDGVGEPPKVPGLRRDDTLTTRRLLLHLHPHRTAPTSQFTSEAWTGSQQRVSVRHTEGSRSIRTMGHGRHRAAETRLR